MLRKIAESREKVSVRKLIWGQFMWGEFVRRQFVQGYVGTAALSLP